MKGGTGNDRTGQPSECTQRATLPQVLPAFAGPGRRDKAEDLVLSLVKGTPWQMGHQIPPNLYTNSSAVDALQALLLRGGSQDVLQCVELEGGWELLRTSAGHEDGVAQLAW